MPVQDGFVYLVAIIDWASRAGAGVAAEATPRRRARIRKGKWHGGTRAMRASEGIWRAGRGKSFPHRPQARSPPPPLPPPVSYEGGVG